MIRLPDRALTGSFLSGLLLALAYPRPDFGVLAWFALVPLFILMCRRPFASGFAAGVGFFGVVLYWLNIVMTTYGKMHPVFSVAAYLLLVLYLSLFFAAVTWAACRLQAQFRLSFVLTLPILWVAGEFLRSFLLSGFPWALLGYSQQSLPWVIQSADLFGVYGISFLVILVNASLAQVLPPFYRRQFTAVPWTGIIAASLLFAANLGYGIVRLQGDLGSRGHEIQVALIQGNIDQGVKWDPGYQQTTIDIYRDLSLQATGRGRVDLIVWPESATPFYFQDSSRLQAEVTRVPAATDAFLLFGSPAYMRKPDRTTYLNSAFLLDHQGEILGRSDKVHLVPFGEYVPFGPLLPFIDKLVVGIGDFSPGTVSPLPMNGAKVGVLVCFEGIFPELARDYVQKGSDLLVNITNDAWFGRSSAPYQHLAMTRFRAVENRIWIARAANTGVSALISPSGAVTAQTDIFTAAALTGKVGLGAATTVYTRIGDLLPTAALGVSVIWLLRAWWQRRRTGGKIG